MKETAAERERPADPAPRPGRRARGPGLVGLGLAVAVVLVAGVIGGLVAFRIPMAEMLLADLLARQGIPAAAFEIEAFGTGRVRAVDVTAGDSGEVRVGALTLDYDLAALLGGETVAAVSRVTVEAPRVRLDLTGRGPLLGSLHPLLAPGGPSGSDARPGLPPRPSLPPAALLPPVALSSGVIEALTPLGPVTLGLAGDVLPDGEGRPRARLALTDIGRDDARFESAALTLDLDPDRIAAEARIAAGDGPVMLRLSTRIRDYLLDPGLDLSLSLEGDAEAPVLASVLAPVLASLDLPRPDRGRLRLDLRTWGRLPPLSRFGDLEPVRLGPAKARPFLSWLLAGNLGAELSLEATDIGRAGLLEGLSGQLDATASIAAGAFRAALVEDARVSLAALDPAAVLDLAAAPGQEPPPALANLPTRDLSLSLAAGGDRPTRLTLQADSRGAGLRLATAAALTTAAGPQALSLAGLFEFRLDPSLRPTALAAKALVLEAQDLRLKGIRVGRLGLTGSLLGGFEQSGAYDGRLELADGKLDLPDLGLAVEGLRLDARLDERANVRDGWFRIGRLLRRRDPVAVPMALQGTLSGRDGRYRAEVAVEPADPALETPRPLARLAVTYDSETGRGTARLPETLLDFAPDGLQPADLSPLLQAFRAVSGQARISADLAAGAGPPKGTARVALSNLSLKHGEVSIEDLDLALDLSRLRPPRSPPGQSLSVGALDVGVTIEGLESRFRVLPGRLPGAHLETLAFTLGGGRFSLRDTTVAPDSGRFAFDLEVEDLALERILPQIGIEGLSGQGGLSGTLPVQVLDGSAVVIAKGRLGTSGPGILRYRSAALSSSLPPDADALDLFRSPLDLAILALRDFHYDSLAITLDKEAGGRSKLFLELEGRNPALLEGYPFKFNINLTGNVNPILDAVRRGSALSDALLRETWMLRP